MDNNDLTDGQWEKVWMDSYSDAMNRALECEERLANVFLYEKEIQYALENNDLSAVAYWLTQIRCASDISFPFIHVVKMPVRLTESEADDA